jgi:spermidine synthase
MHPTSISIPIRGKRLFYQAEVTGHVYSGRTEFQQIDIYDTFSFGRFLLLDGHPQLAELDEFAYHEALVHIPAQAVSNLRRALVVGGGDGGTLRELCKYPQIEHIRMVEIDQGVVDVCREHLPGLSDGAFDDPRVELVIGDAFPYVKETSDRFDLIVVDSTDVFEDEEGLSEMLFTEDFYQDCRRILNEGGAIVTQADNLVFCPWAVEDTLPMFRRLFGNAGSYQALVPSFGGYSGYCWASKGSQPPAAFTPPASLSLRYLSDLTYRLAFQKLPFETPN